MCWTYDDRREFILAALEFLADGLAGGHRLMYVSGRSTRQMLEDLPDFEAAERLWP